jgi:streptothricin acetyltransferase
LTYPARHDKMVGPVETQNTNVPACRFYARQGCVSGGINRFGYAGCPAAAPEAMLLWYLDLVQ